MKGKSTFILLIFSLFFSLSLRAQEIDVSGKVTSKSDGLPLPGVSVKIQGTNTGVATDQNGVFRIKVPKSGSVLEFSQIGMATQTFVVNNTQPINIVMTASQSELEEVVVVGYGTQKKSVVTGAISQVKASDLENMPVTRIEQSLQGRTAGLTITTSSGQPGDGATLRIRGTTSINNSEALYIVDGVQVGGGIDYLNQADIESIEVLKDAASAAIYGARAANGVIIVTTKRGNKNGKMSVNYNTYLGTQAPSRKLDLLNATQYATLYNEAEFAANPSVGTPRFPNPSQYGVGTDWQSAVFNNSAKIQNHELSLSGGNEKSTYYSSFGYFDQDGIVASDNSKYKRFTARFNSEHQLAKHIKFGQTIGYTRTNSVGVATNTEYGSPLNRAINIDPITPIVETDPAKYNLPLYTGNPVVRNAQGFPYGISSYAQSEILNPLAALAVAQGRGWSDKIVGNAFVEVEVIKGLKLRSQGGVDLAFWGSDSFTPIYYLNSINQTTITSYNRNTNRGLFWSLENTISYNKAIERHNFTVLLGYSAQKNKGETNGGSKDGIPVNNIKDASLQFPVSRANDVFYGGEYLNTLNSMFARLTYNYDEKYLFTGIVRRDGSSRFGPNNKYGYFPSGSVGWIASNENFFPKNKVVTFLKFRGSYGITGNDNIGDFRYLSTVSGGRNYTLGTSAGLNNGVSPDALSNPDLRWEETSSTDIGMDATLFGNFTITADWYHKKTSGMLLQIAVPGYVGNSGPIGNIADLSNKGFELELGYNKKLGDVSFRVAANASFLTNNIDFLGDDKDFLGGQTVTPQGLEVTRTKVGYAIGSFYGYRSDGLFQTQADITNYKNSAGGLIQPNARPGDIKFRDLNGDGLISDNDREIIGDPTPDFTYGLTFNVAYKGFDMVVLGQGVAGNQIFNALRRFDLPTANYTTAILNRWTGPGTSNTTPRLTLADDNKNYSRVSSLFIEDGSYFRIKTLQLGYSLPTNLIRKAGLNKLRFYVMANNLLTLTKYTGYDPEIGGGSYGVDRGFYPQARTFFAGLNVGF
ncbi:SusC/RagA family TonB-linked outer membrane protein [Pedobacter sp. LMG 31464]|uniref:SusC/RagA family TonB-linked outer membrane protein n=1 Tax=Pedobacter planticolens TaxID=2679964 RepID=A0A923IUQ3_9SPHI|nr:TonB-dependent receptor [Pedobacter planticolens]MBB2145018.1 SusC/RagA family TonB-linked outer membrane protein [Pedobacter planticolens]